MLGITSSGCFVLGTIVGFIGAGAVGIAVYFYYHPEEKKTNISQVEEVWNKVKKSGDGAISTIKNIQSPDPKKIYQKAVSQEPNVPVPPKQR